MKVVLDLQLLAGSNSYESHIAIDAFINGIKAFLIVDTGASNSVLDTNAVEKFYLTKKSRGKTKKAIGIGDANLKSRLAVAENIEFAGFFIKDFPIVLIDISIINKTFEEFGYKQIDGILGNDILLATKAIINYKKSTITFSGNKKDIDAKIKKLLNAHNS